MRDAKDEPTTSIATSTSDDVFIRGRSLCRDLLGKVSFTEMIYLQVTGRPPTPQQVVALDACLVCLVEHGLTPSVLAARMTYASAPESMQGAVAAGLQGVGSLFVGTVEGCALLLARIVAASDPAAAADEIVAAHRAAGQKLPGFGHPQHRPDDPRSIRLLAIADEQGIAGRHVEALRRLAQAVDAAYGRHITINATGAFAAVLADCDIPAEIMRGFALIARCAGLVGHIHEEQSIRTLEAVWHAAEAAVPYSDSES